MDGSDDNDLFDDPENDEIGICDDDGTPEFDDGIGAYVADVDVHLRRCGDGNLLSVLGGHKAASFEIRMDRDRFERFVSSARGLMGWDTEK